MVIIKQLPKIEFKEKETTIMKDNFKAKIKKNQTQITENY